VDGVELYFGWRTALLGLAVVQMLALAIAVAGRPENRIANRLLAAFLVALSGFVTPYVIGFAGAYDAWRWLTFAPFSIPLVLPPLLYGYSQALISGRTPPRFELHMILPGVQLAYFLIAFALPLGPKWEWYTGAHSLVVAPVFQVAFLASLAAYAVATVRLLERYRAALAEHRSDDDRFAASWLTRVIVALVAVLTIYSAFVLWDWISGGIDFFQETGLYLAVSAIGLYLGVEGWRHAALRFPDVQPPVAVELRTEPDWSAVAAEYDARLRAEGWAREPDLSLPSVARRLATNTGRVSRAINQGLGVNFSAWINGVRAEAVAAALDTGSTQDLLTLAFDAGFSSKASFNRAFQARFGVAPSRYRRGVSHPDFLVRKPEMRRATG
jgi:AraC-like DNA-binding protein